ncbi:MAG: uL14 family ribosomal protein [Candidatus Micrarchaeia archaeon]
MRGLTSKISKTLIPKSRLVCADNSGAKILKIIGKLGKGGGKNKLAKAGVGDVIIASVTSGSPQYVKTKVKAIIIRQKSPIRRMDGTRVIFEDNAAILVNDVLLPIATEVKGAMAREVIERNIKLAEVAQRVI